MDIGITGVDHAMIETGKRVLAARKVASRVVSLLVHIRVAIVELGQVLPSLDELFILRRSDLLERDTSSYMNIISGPSRSPDIEQTLITGVHGSREVHMALQEQRGSRSGVV